MKATFRLQLGWQYARPPLRYAYLSLPNYAAISAFCRPAGQGRWCREVACMSNGQWNCSDLLLVILSRAAHCFSFSVLYSSEFFCVSSIRFWGSFSCTYTFQLHSPAARWEGELAGDALPSRAHGGVSCIGSARWPSSHPNLYTV